MERMHMLACDDNDDDATHVNRATLITSYDYDNNAFVFKRNTLGVIIQTARE